MGQKRDKIALEPFSGLANGFTHPGQRKARISELLRFAGPSAGRWAVRTGKLARKADPKNMAVIGTAFALRLSLETTRISAILASTRYSRFRNTRLYIRVYKHI